MTIFRLLIGGKPVATFDAAGAVLQTIDGAGRPLASYSLAKSSVANNYKGPNLSGNSNDIAFEALELTPIGLSIPK